MTGVSTDAPPLADEPAAPPGRGRPLPGRRAGKGRGRRQHALLRLRGDIPLSARIALGVGGGVSVILFWLLAAALWSTQVPTPGRTIGAGVDLWQEGELWPDLVASTMRVAQGYAISMLIGIVLGIAIGSYRSIEAYWEAPIGFLRYIPATALTPLFLVWLGIDEAPKIALIVVGTVFYNVLMIADVARAVPREMVTSAYTLGASRVRVLRRVILPHSWPGIIDVARINLAAAWLMLVVAELLAADDGLAAELTRAYRFRRVDTMFAILVVFGIIGVASDLALRWIRNRSAPWARS